MNKNLILGISAYFHDSSAVLLDSGRIKSAAQEERFTRRKNDWRYPRAAVDYVLSDAGIELREVSRVVYYEDPGKKFGRALATQLAIAPRGFYAFEKFVRGWRNQGFLMKSRLVNDLKQHRGGFPDARRLFFSNHHLSHAASAFYPSNFKRAVILTLDGVGEWATGSISIGEGRNLKIIRELRFPHSLGLLYSTFTAYLGFRVDSGEYKVMGLAPYGMPIYKDLIIENLLEFYQDGSFRTKQEYFNYGSGSTMYSEQLCMLFGKPPRESNDAPIEQFHMDVAASIQSVLEEIVVRIGKDISVRYSCKNLCLAGGVSLNCVANSKLLASSFFENIWVQPAAGDAGGALGAALAAWHLDLENERTIEYEYDAMQGSYLGPQFSDNEIEATLIATNVKFDKVGEAELVSTTARAIADGKSVGWFQGRMEFGPRALGNRSILADPRSTTMQRTLNLKIKNRESFRPFAPAVLLDFTNAWFEFDGRSPYMLFTATVRSTIAFPPTETEKCLSGFKKLTARRSMIPAVTHVDGSARLQTVDAETNPKFFSLIECFRQITGCPLLINTSFNVRGEPIVCAPIDAVSCFLRTDLEFLAIGSFILRKEIQNSDLRARFAMEFEPD